MKPLPLAALAMLAGLCVPVLPAAPAAAGFVCSRQQAPVLKSACADPELARIDKAVETAVARVLAAADPLTAMLLRRDQNWFGETLGNVDSVNIDAADDGEIKRLRDALKTRLAALERMAVRAESLAGTWTNAFSDAEVETGAGGGLRVKITSRVVYPAADEVAGCSATAEVKRDDGGWFTGAAINTTDGAEPPPDNNPFKLRLRLQGNTLRVVLTHDEQDSFCGKAEQVTGSYFLVGAAARADAKAAPAVAPSFDCATAKNPDALEICADPGLAGLDVEIARAYQDVLKHVDARLAGQLREDQRAWVKANATAFETQINAPWDKQTYMVHKTGNAREELGLRLGERLALLTNLDAARKGVAGLWAGHNALLAILPDEATKDFRAAGRKWDSEDYKSYCNFEAKGRIVNGAFKTTDSFPDLARDGATLVIGGRERTRPEHCNRMTTSKARLFPVKAGAQIGISDDRIR